MPGITINTPTQPFIGPGVVVSGTSDFIGPLEPGSFFRISVEWESGGSTHELMVHQEQYDGGPRAFNVLLGVKQGTQTVFETTENAPELATVSLLVQLMSPEFTPLANASLPAQWTASSSLWQLVNAHAAVSAHDPVLDTVLNAVQQPVKKTP